MARRRNTRRRRNATTITVRSRRRNRSAVRATGRRRANPHRRRRRNPTLFGSQVTSMELGKSLVGGLVGVAVAKLIPPMLPGGLTSSPAMKVIITGAVAFGAGMLGNKLGGNFGSAMLFGGLMQTMSIALNAFIPSIGGQIGLSGFGRGMGELVPGQFSQPQNVVNWRALAAPAMPMAAPAGVSGLGLRAFGRAF